jgi:small subunit ribosomal protein S7e
MFAQKKIVKEKGAEPEPFEIDVAQAICDLEANSNDLKAELRELYIVSAKEVDVAGRKAVVIFVPFKLLKIVHKIQSRLVREVRPLPPVACVSKGLVGKKQRRCEGAGR